MSTPYLSIVIPVYNEESILAASVTELVSRLGAHGWSYEILLMENGSRDATIAVGENLGKTFPGVEIHSAGVPDYGAAMRAGILRARGTYVMCDEIDLCDVDFYERALKLLDGGEADLVVGSKVMKGAEDKRPFLRHMATLVISGMLRVMVGFRGTDTHGLKAFRREALLDTVSHCQLSRDLFASEFVIRAEREKKRVREVPIRIAEKRPPSVGLFKRVPKVLKDILRLTYMIRFR